MSMLSLLTVVFITLKVVGQIDWSWWLVLSPTLIQFLLILLVLFGHAIVGTK